MKKYSAHYIFSNTSEPLKRGIVSLGDDGTITDLEDTGGLRTEREAVQFLDGIIIPGFVNCHCHLELSHMHGVVPEGKGLGDFIMNIRGRRESTEENIIAAATDADREMYSEGISLCADICNTSLTFGLKHRSNIRYYNLLEVFGIDPMKAVKRMQEASVLARQAEAFGFDYSVVPHSVYSVSLSLFRMIKAISLDNEVTSVHFMETEGETLFLSSQKGSLMDSYIASELLPPVLELTADHHSAVMNEITGSGNLILVHNTFADQGTVRKLSRRDNLFWCLCPASNIYIEKKLPPVAMLNEEHCTIVIGTDSLASNKRLSMLSELRIIQDSFEGVSLGDLIKWSTLNGAAALGKQDEFGAIRPGMKPGLLLLENVDVQKMRLLPETTVRRLA